MAHRLRLFVKQNQLYSKHYPTEFRLKTPPIHTTPAALLSAPSELINHGPFANVCYRKISRPAELFWMGNGSFFSSLEECLRTNLN